MRARIAPCAAALVAVLASSGVAAQATDAAAAPAPADDPWALGGVYTHSDLGPGRDDWQQLDLDLYRRVGHGWVVRGGATTRRRDDTTDATLLAGAEYHTGAWRFHGSVAATPDADFSYERAYTLGADWRATPWLSLLLDARRFDFPLGDLREVRPGATFWFNDDATAVTLRYTEGDAFDGVHYDAWSVRLDQVLLDDHRLSLVHARGTDPERDPALPGVLLTEGDFYAAYYRFPVRANGPELLFGVEYEDREPAWTRKGIAIGFVTRF